MKANREIREMACRVTKASRETRAAVIIIHKSKVENIQVPTGSPLWASEKARPLSKPGGLALQQRGNVLTAASFGKMFMGKWVIVVREEFDETQGKRLGVEIMEQVDTAEVLANAARPRPPHSLSFRTLTKSFNQEAGSFAPFGRREPQPGFSQATR